MWADTGGSEGAGFVQSSGEKTKGGITAVLNYPMGAVDEMKTNRDAG